MTTNFPSLEGADYGQDGTPILGNSIGNNRIFYYFRQAALEQLSPPIWNVYLINIFTLVRNAYSKGLSYDILEKIIDKDSDLFMTYIDAYVNYKKESSSIVYFYAPIYKAILPQFKRVPVGNALELNTLYEKLYQTIPEKVTELTQNPRTRKFVSRAGAIGVLPYIDLLSKLKSIQTNYGNGTLATTMISHCPLDFYIYKKIPKIQLLESYTGQILSLSQFGSKLTKDVQIPFNRITHRAFGDSVQLLPLFTGKDRKTLIQLATEKNWILKTEQDILADILFKFPNIMQSDLTLLKM